MEWPDEHRITYLDSSSWIRLFERGSDAIVSEKDAVNEILEMCRSSKYFSVISSKFQYGQLVELERNATSLHRRQTYRRARNIRATYCPHSIKIHTDYHDVAKKNCLN